MIDCSIKSALESLHAQTANLLVHKLGRMVSREVAEEISQEIYLRIWREKMRFPNIAAAYSYIYRGGHNRAIDEIRRRRGLDRVNSNTEVRLPFCGPHDRVCRSDLNQALSNLTEQQGQIIWYCSVDEMTQDEVAELLGVSRKTIQRELIRASTKLLELLQEKSDESRSSIALQHT